MLRLHKNGFRGNPGPEGAALTPLAGHSLILIFRSRPPGDLPTCRPADLLQVDMSTGRQVTTGRDAMRRTAHGRVWLSSDALPLGFGHRWCDEAQKESSMRIKEWTVGEMIPVQANRWKGFCGERKHEENSG